MAARPPRHDPTGHERVPIDHGDVDAFVSFQTNQPIQLKLQDIETTTFLLADYGFNLFSDSLFVTESHRRRGVGDALMSRAMAWLAQRATSSLAVEVMACNADALSLYERYGFHQRTVRMLHVCPPEAS